MILFQLIKHSFVHVHQSRLDLWKLLGASVSSVFISLSCFVSSRPVTSLIYDRLCLYFRDVFLLTRCLSGRRDAQVNNRVNGSVIVMWYGSLTSNKTCRCVRTTRMPDCVFLCCHCNDDANRCDCT